MKIRRYPRLHVKDNNMPKYSYLLFEIYAPDINEMFIYKYTETIVYVIKVDYFLRKIQTSQVYKSRIFRIKYTIFSGYCFCMSLNIS